MSIMKIRNITIMIIAATMFFSCGKPDAKKQISRLEGQRTELQSQINDIDNEISVLRGSVNDSAIIKYITVTAEELQISGFKDHFTVQGDVESDNNILVPAEYGGVVRSIKYDEGAYVKKGTLLAEIDNEIILRQKAEVETALELAQQNYRRQKSLWDQQIGSEMQFLQAENQKKSLEKKLETLSEQVLKTKVYAPIDGSIDKVFIKEAEIVQMGMGAFRIVQLSNLKITADVSEKYVSEVVSGDSVSVEFSDLNVNFASKINAVAQVINIDNRTFAIEVRIPDIYKYIKPNMIGKITVYNYINPNALSVPMNILQKNENGYFVFVAVKNAEGYIAERRNVKIDRNNSVNAEIVSGVKVGDMLITDGYQNLSNLQNIEIVEAI
jgi:RND family efflux transporter MFP subunit